MVLIRPDSRKVSSRYLLYALQSPFVQHEIGVNEGTGSTVSNLRIPVLEALPIPICSAEEQDRIANILGTLDDKIELNRRMNDTLEMTARTIFESWFLNFNPVRAKAERRRPFGMDTQTATLFPADLRESDQGLIPSGWLLGTFGEVASERKKIVKPDQIGEGMSYIGLEHMPRCSIALSDWGTAEEVASNKSAFRKGDILFGKLRPYFHKVGVAAVDGVCSTDIVVVVPKLDTWFGFVLFHASSDGFIDYTDGASTGTRMPRTNWKDMSRYKIVLPPEPIANAFNQLIEPFIEQIIHNIHETRTLIQMRDALLPKLLNGSLSLAKAA